MAQPGEDSGLALHKETILENKWKASKARLLTIIDSIGTTDPHPCAAPVISEQLDQAKKYMVSVFDERTAILAPAEQDELIEDLNKLEKVYNGARSRLRNVEIERIHARFPSFAGCDDKYFFTFFESAIRLDNATKDEEKEVYVKNVAGGSKFYGADKYFREKAGEIARVAALEMHEMERTPLTLLLERFRRCIYLLSFTGHDRDWEFLLLSIIRRCFADGEGGSAQEALEKVIRSFVDGP